MATPDPAKVETATQLAAALEDLRGTRSLRDLQAAAKDLTGADGRSLALPTSTVSDALKVKSLPSVETLVTLLRVCGISDEPAQRAWLQARERVEHRHQHRPPDAVRVRDARPRLLGVHAAIRVGQAGQAESGGDELPLYVPRDFDADLRTTITLAGQQGGFVLLVGGSSTGKTRALFEAVRAVLPDWWLLHPPDASALKKFGATPTVRTVVWLDELQRYLDHPEGLPAATIRRLVGAGVVVAATLWPSEYSKRSIRPAPGQPDPKVGDRELLGMAEVTDVPKMFSPSEQTRAKDLAADDTRLRVALDTPDSGFTQVMAAGPELVRWWEQAPDEQCYGQAVITAALDARRVGAHSPLTRAYLEAAAPGYLTERQQATAPTDWLDQSLAYATTLLRGATATLTPVPATMGTVAGYEVADYLHQHALRTRRTTHLPDIAWHALVDHHHPDDTRRLAESADRRARDTEAETLYQQLADRGDTHGAAQLASVLFEQGRIDDLTRRADNGDWYATSRLADLLIKQGRTNEAVARLCLLVDSGDRHAGGGGTFDLLAVEGRIDELIDGADSGNIPAAHRLASLLAKQSRIDELIDRADNGNTPAAYRLIHLLTEQGQVDDALTRLRALVDNGDRHAAAWRVDLLAEQGRIDELTLLADTGELPAAHRLVEVLVKLDRVDEAEARLRRLVGNGDTHAALQLAIVLTNQGRIDEVTHRADQGDDQAATWLAIVLTDQGRTDEALTRLRALADQGDRFGLLLLAAELAKQGLIDELANQADSGNTQAAFRLIDVLAEQGRLDELARRADNGNEHAASRLAAVLASQGRLDELARRADNGNAHAASRLAAVLAEQGRVDEAVARLRPLVENGDTLAGHRLVTLLAKHCRINELAAEVAAGTESASAALRSAADTPSQHQLAPEK